MLQELHKVLDDLNLDKLSTIFYSHEHPDHLSWKTLKDIRERVKQDIMIVFKDRENKNIMKQCQKLGYDFAEIFPNQETELRENFTVGLFPHGADSALVYRVDGKVILKIGIILQNKGFEKFKSAKNVNKTNYPEFLVYI